MIAASSTVINDFANEITHTGWPKKVSHYQMIKKSLNRIKACQ